MAVHAKWQMREPSIMDDTENRSYPLRIGLLISNHAKKLLNQFIQKNEEQLNHFFEFTNSFDQFTCTGLYGGKILDGKFLPTSKYWKTTKLSHIEHYRQNVVPILYPFLTSLDDPEDFDRKIRYLFIEIGISRNSVFVKGDYLDNPLNFGLKTAIWCHEQTAI